MSEQTSNPTSGQNVPKSKFRRKSRQEQTAASKLRMERRGEKLDTAREKLAKQKPPKKPGAVKRLAHTAGHGVHGFVHGKLYEVEHENVGTEGAHRSELAAESVYRFGRRKLRKAIREHPAKAVERAESKHIKATADYYYRKTVEEHPEMQEGGAVSRYLQKQKIKRQYAKQAREAARQTAKAAEGTASVTGKLTEKVSAYIKEHPGGLLLLLAAFLLLVVLQSCMSSLVTVGNGVAGAIGASTYAAEDADLLGAEAAYCALEDELQRYLDTYTRTHDYDEYHFDLDTIEHDPYVLLSMQALHKDAEVYIADFKGGVDYPKVWHEKCRMCFTEEDLLYTLNQLVAVLEYRKKALKELGSPNIDAYNETTENKLPRLIFACDEVAEVLDKTGRSKEDKELLAQIENRLSTIARLGRAFGIHLILATQRPDANIIPGQIKNNMDFRVCGRADSVLSQIILDNTSAAEQIPKDARGRFITGDGTVFQGYLFDEGQL